MGLSLFEDWNHVHEVFYFIVLLFRMENFEDLLIIILAYQFNKEALVPSPSIRDLLAKYLFSEGKLQFE
jgi:hypothetical protein